MLQNRAWNAARKQPLPAEELLLSANEACRYFIGTHDFTAFKASGGLAKTTVRTILSARVSAFPENLFYLEICGDGFLYNMVKIIVGTLLEVSEGRLSAADLPSVIAGGKRENAGRTAPPEGLYLHKVFLRR